jgi:Cu/Ag efflux protein CusF
MRRKGGRWPVTSARGGRMKRMIVGMIVAAALVSPPRVTAAQSKEVTSEIKTQSGIVEAIEAQSRSVTIRKPDGTVVTTVAGPDVKRFDEIKVGDKINARYYENLVIRVKAPGEPAVDTDVKDATASGQVLPGGTKTRQRTLTCTIAAIDLNTPTITFTSANGWKYTSKVRDKSLLAKVKVGDKVDIVWTDALLVSIER